MIMLDNRLNKKQQEAVETTEGRIKSLLAQGLGKPLCWCIVMCIL